MNPLGFLIIFLPLAMPALGTYAQDKANAASNAQNDVLRTWDFGRVNAGAILEHNFAFTNESGKTLKITGINTSCGCTVSKIKKEILAPGEATEIEVKFNTRGYSGPTQQFVFVNTDSPDNPVIRFTIKAEVVKK